MRKRWWKILAVLLIGYTLTAGLLADVPRLPILNETIRVLHFHVPMWFGMLILLTTSVVYSVKYLRNPTAKNDLFAVEFANAGILFGILGLATGSLWARFAWGAFWTSDPKLNNAAIAMLIYFAYLILRGSFDDEQRRGRVSAIYNIFAFATLVPLLFILPRMTDSLHPGNGGNPGFNTYDIDSNLRMVFYPAIVGWTLIGVWLASLRIRMKLVKQKIDERFEENLLRTRNRAMADDSQSHSVTGSV
uniref:Heme exporter protein C n=1 Tax=Roseihalotalea indica TaxID=2867963 RepID=A0AA49JI35_9BACT|nr:cytochrome c biogenesis protein CcsA [Tunicatimonas sp. TK19036]